MQTSISRQIYNLAKKLWPINRSITGDGVRETLSIIKEEVPELKVFEISSGTKVFDWSVPQEWKVRDAYIVTPDGKKICQFKENNLHLIGYSTSINLKISLSELQDHLYSLPDQPNAIPYITSYYEKRWGFCITHNERQSLKDGNYQVYIDAELFDGSLSYGEILIKGKSSEEIFISTYICHPSMANNELSGPCVTTFLAKKLKNLESLKYSYRLIFVPETIGSISYLSKNIEHLKKNVVAGFNVTCVGDDRDYSYLPSRKGNTLSDQISKHVLKHICPTFKSYLWADRGSDERQYCAPNVDLPIASIMRTKYGKYDEYHTSLDDLINVVTEKGLEGGFNALWKAIEALEKNSYPKVKIICEPQLGKRDLYPTLLTKHTNFSVRQILDLITWSDGTRSLIEIAELCNSPIWDLYPVVKKLIDHKLLELYDKPS
jgi:aminopeptidase-like protein